MNTTTPADALVPRFLLTVKQVAAFAQVPVSTVKSWTYRLKAKGRLECLTIGKHKRFVPEEVARFFKVDVNYLLTCIMA